MWGIAANVYQEGNKEVIHRYCDGEAKAWNATVEDTDTYVPTSDIVVIVCNANYHTYIDVYKREKRWEVLRVKISSCDDFRYVLPMIGRLLMREGFDNVSDVVDYIAEYWARQIRRWAQL
jgi:endo-1,4-beta-mannosidase